MDQIKTINNQKTLTSMEVAEMVEKDHKDLLKSIRQHIEYLGQGKIAPSEYFIESTYMNSQNKEQPCFLITKKGCDLVAHKLTGAKGTVFTAKYIERFEQMEQTLLQGISPELQAIIMQDKKLVKIDERVVDLEENQRLDAGQYGHVSNQISKRIAYLKEVHNWDFNKKQNGELFHGLNKDIIEITGARTRTSLRQKDFDKVCEFIGAWEPSSATMQKIKDLCGTQL